MSADRGLARAWYGGLLGGLLPILLLGFLYSALADRTVFALWALVVAAAWIVVLRTGLQDGWPRGRRIAALAALLAGALAGFALLETKFHEILDLGYRAVFYRFYHPIATSPQTAWILAAVSALAAVAALAFTSPLSRWMGGRWERGPGGEGPSESRPPSPAPLGRGKGGGVHP